MKKVRTRKSKSIFNYSERAPVRDISVTGPSERIIALRLEHKEDLAGNEIPLLTQSVPRIRSTEPIAAQFGRLDTTQSAMAYYAGVGYCE